MKRLVADIGGTNTRCALIGDTGGPERVTAMRNDDHADLGDALEAFLATQPAADQPHEAALAVAAPINGDQIDLTNRSWHFSREALRERLRLNRLEVVNDFTAIAYALPELADGDVIAIGDGQPAVGGALAVLGPGTGLGVSGLIPLDAGWAALHGEGGHVTLAASNDLEARVIARQREKVGHVSAERVLSGPGLLALYVALAEELGLKANAIAPEEIASQAAQGAELAQRTLDMFFEMLGTVASNLALTLDARGGVYLAGGILPALREPFLASRFRERFEAKGRYSNFVRAIPTYLIVAKYPALIGLQRALG